MPSSRPRNLIDITDEGTVLVRCGIRHHAFTGGFIMHAEMLEKREKRKKKKRVLLWAGISQMMTDS